MRQTHPPRCPVTLALPPFFPTLSSFRRLRLQRAAEEEVAQREREEVEKARKEAETKSASPMAAAIGRADAGFLVDQSLEERLRIAMMRKVGRVGSGCSARAL